MITSSSATGASTGSSTSSSKKSAESLNQTYDNFMKLLTTQMKNQDPLDPMDNNQLTTQLVQFTLAEQAISTNKNLEQLVQLNQSNAVTDALKYLGQEVQARGDTAKLSNGKANFSYELKDNAETVTINILDSKGFSVKTLQGDVSKGSHELTWDGKSDAGVVMPEDNYTITISAMDKFKNPVSTVTTIQGIVDNVEVNGSNVILKVNGKDVKAENVTSIRKPVTQTTSNQ